MPYLIPFIFARYWVTFRCVLQGLWALQRKKRHVLGLNGGNPAQAFILLMVRQVSLKRKTDEDLLLCSFNLFAAKDIDFRPLLQSLLCCNTPVIWWIVTIRLVYKMYRCVKEFWMDIHQVAVALAVDFWGTLSVVGQENAPLTCNENHFVSKYHKKSVSRRFLRISFISKLTDCNQNTSQSTVWSAFCHLCIYILIRFQQSNT